MVLLSDKEVEGSKLQQHEVELSQSMYSMKKSNRSVMQTKHTVTNMKITAKFCGMLVTKLVLRVKKLITKQC